MSQKSLLTINGNLNHAWEVPMDCAEAIREACVERRKPYLRLPQATRNTIYALGDALFGGFTLQIGTPSTDEEPELPTWREYLTEQGVDVGKVAAVRKWLKKESDHDPDDVNLDDPIDGDLVDHWIHWTYDLYKSPMARVHRYLASLPLTKKRRSTDGCVLGNLEFIEGDRPGSNVTYVEAPDLATLACLQERLKELGEPVKIEICES